MDELLDDSEDEFDEEDDEMAETMTHHQVLEKRGVIPVTQIQLDSGWWNRRPFSATSSTRDRMITSAVPFITEDHPMRSRFETILKYTGQLSLLPGVEVEEDDDSNTDNKLKLTEATWRKTGIVRLNFRMKYC